MQSGTDKVTSKSSESSKYTSLSCDNGGKGDDVITARWDLWIPTIFLQNQGNDLKEGDKINVKAETITIETPQDVDDWDLSITKFTSKSFVEPEITGKWGGGVLNGVFGDEEKQVYTVKIMEPQTEENSLMYLRY
ncbi:hypothetical protein [Mycoplasma ovis]|uniref:hypothetical protein n=1 Tax=Mycoplasma ovis TaxID=171632 RepID=UPI001182243E|nr:hypothetical protein [Mycoplasma ovis]